MPRKLRAAAQAAAQSMKTAPPSFPDVSDEEMADAPASPASSPVAEHGNDVKDDPDAEPQPAPEQDPQPAPSSPPEEGDTPSRMGRVSAIMPRKRRIGRPPKNRPPDWDLPDDSPLRQVSVSTPVRRKRGRPAASGGRWGRRGGTPHKHQVAVDKEGTMMDVEDDEVVVPEDPEGETKVDKMGHLLGSREYRVRTFTLLNRGERQYMLSTEPARCIGFRDSYLFFQKHRLLYKIIIDDDAKRDLIEREIIPHSYKGRAIGVVTARSVFREFGAKIVIGGQKIVDDYNVKAARARGDVEGELAVPEDKLPPPGEPYNRNQYVAWHGASAVYHTNAPSLPLPNGKMADPKKRKVTVTGDNWMLEHARESSRYNSAILNSRREVLNGSYDVHTNTVQYPRIMQPTHARWERQPSPGPQQEDKFTTKLSALRLTNGTDQADENSTGIEATTEEVEDGKSIFPSVPSLFTRRFVIADVQYETPESNTFGFPGPDGGSQAIGPNGILRMNDNLHPEFMSPDILSELPQECKEALVEAAAQEWTWKSKWQSEAANTGRTLPTKSYAWYP